MPELSARQLGTAALLMIGVASAEQPISAFIAENTREALNSMLDNWATERLWTPMLLKIPLAMVPGQAAYTWGITTPAADIARQPPMRLDAAVLRVDTTPPGLEWPVKVLDQRQYEAGIWQKALASTYPSCVYLEPSVPVQTLYVWPVPDQGHTLNLFAQCTSAPYGHWDEVLPWPIGYQRPITYGLAIEIAPQYGVEPSQTILRIAEESKRSLYPINAVVGKLSLHPGRPVGGTPLGYPRGFLEGTR